MTMYLIVNMIVNLRTKSLYKNQELKFFRELIMLRTQKKKIQKKKLLKKSPKNTKDK